MSSGRVNKDHGVARTDPAGDTRPLRDLRVAIVHHWFRSYTGAERVIAVILELFPQADLFGLVAHEEGAVPFAPRQIKTSFLQHFPGSRRFHRYFLPLYPFALEQFDFGDYDLVISSESGPAKGIITPAHVCHICYCHSPMRYIWDLYQQYVSGNDMSGVSRIIFKLAAHYMRLWDVTSAARVDYFLANSRNTASRIRKIYRRESQVIYPPVPVDAGYISDRTDDYYLIVGRLVDYKRVDLAIEACNLLGRRLHVVGVGPQYERLRKVSGTTTQFFGALQDEELREQYAHCRALLFPGNEDFGIVVVEAHSFGKPVIAYGQGGALETIRGPFADDGSVESSCNGMFFASQTPSSLAGAILAFEKAEAKFSSIQIARSALRFSAERFKIEMTDAIVSRYNEFRSGDVHKETTCRNEVPIGSSDQN